MSADKLILGDIITMEPGHPRAEALTVKDGRIQFAGSEETARALCGEATEVLDYRGSFVYPGIVEGHCHPDMAGSRIKWQADLTAGESMPEYVEMMAGFIAQNPGLDEYRGAGWCERECKPTAAMLDAICPDVPVVLQSVDGHSMWLNTPGMAKYGIDAAAAEYWGTDIIRLGEDGSPTGYISEGPVNKITMSASYTDDQRDAAYLAWQDFAFEHGLTACLHAGITESTCRIYERLEKSGKLKIRTYGVFMVDEHVEDYVDQVRVAKELAERYNSEHFKVVGIKIFMDGVVEAHTAWMCEGYEDDPDNTGVKRMCDFDRVSDLYAAAGEAGMFVHAHTIGDGAVKFAVDCIEAAEKRTGNFSARHALCHLQVVRSEDVRRMADLRISPVVAPLWVPVHPLYYPQAVEWIGAQRAAAMYPIRSFVDCGAPVTFHTDYPVSTDMDVPRSVYCAVLRTTPEFGEAGVHLPSERISREQSLAALTSEAAYSMWQEDEIGMVAPGYVANLTVFDSDFLLDDIERVGASKLVATIVDGEVVYSA